jgi:hypothetical protein
VVHVFRDRKDEVAGEQGRFHGLGGDFEGGDAYDAKIVDGNHGAKKDAEIEGHPRA